MLTECLATPPMFKNYFTTAYRNLVQHKSISIINIFGLMLGLTSCMLIMLYVLDELSYDRWVPDAKNIYRYETQRTNSAGTVRSVVKTALRARRDLVEYFPEIKAAVRLIDRAVVLGSGEQKYFETVWFVDDNFFKVFDIPLLLGDKSTALNSRASILLSESMAEKYFGNQFPVGEFLLMDDQKNYQVSGVFKDIPTHSHFDFSFLVLYDQNDPTYSFGYSDSWDAVEAYTYLKLVEGVAIGEIKSQLPLFLETYYPIQSLPQSVQLSDILRPLLTNLLDIHLHSGGVGNIKPPGSSQMIVTLLLIALLVLMIACINFVNLTTIQSFGRAKEISVRKVVGAQKNQLTLQFLCETLLVSLLALAVSVGLVELLLPYYNEILNREISIQYFSDLTFLVGSVFSMVVVGIVSGLYPAHRLSALQPATILKSSFGGSNPNGSLQQVLVALQFAISVTLAITTITIFCQQLFINSKDLGFSAGNKLVIRNVNESFSRESRDILAAEIRRLPVVVDTTFSTAVPSDQTGTGFTRNVSMSGKSDQSFLLYPKSVAANFFEVYKIPFLRGRGFSEQSGVDRFSWETFSNEVEAKTSSASAILNSTAINSLGFRNASQAMGQTVQMGNVLFNVIGVVPDFHFQSLRESITPNMYIFAPEDHIALTVSYFPGADTRQLVDEISKVWDELIAEFPIKIEFLEVNINAQYTQDRLQFLLLTVFSGLAICIACLGLYALASHTALRKTKEIGIRKIHGARSIDIVKTLLSQFSRPVMAANILAWPVSLYVITQYLNSFQYRTEVGLGIFILSSLVAIAIAWLTIVLHAVKAANAKLVDALRFGA